MVVSNSEHVWKGSKGTKHWPHVYVSGVSARTCFTLKLATPEQRACVNNMQTSQRIRFWFFRTVYSQEGQIAAKLFYFFIFSIHHYLFTCLSILWFNLRCRQSSMKTNWCPAQTKILTMHTWSRWRLKEPRNTKSLSQAKVCVCVCTKNVISNTHSALRTDADTTGPSLYCKKIFSTVSFVLTKFQL